MSAVVSYTASKSTSAATSIVHDFPANLAVGNWLLLLVVGNDNDGGDEAPFVSVTDDLLQIRASDPIDNGFVEANIFTKRIDGSEGSTFTVGYNDTFNSCCIAYQLHSRFNPAFLRYSYSTSGGTTTTPDPPSHTSNIKAMEYLWIAAVCHSATGSVTGYPTGYTNGIQRDTGGTHGATLGAAYKLTNLATEDPGTFTLDTARTVGQLTIGIPGASYMRDRTLSSNTTGSRVSI